LSSVTKALDYTALKICEVQLLRVSKKSCDDLPKVICNPVYSCSLHSYKQLSLFVLKNSTVADSQIQRTNEWSPVESGRRR